MELFAIIPSGYKTKIVVSNEAQFYIQKGWSILEIRNCFFIDYIILIKKKKNKTKNGK